MSKVIGIDLGTTNSVVAVMEGGQPTIIPSLTNGGRTLPSVVAFSNNGERIVGINAKKQAVANPNRTIASIKRHMGTDYQVDIDGKKYSPQEISAMILQQLKSDAEAYLGEKVNQAVITVPAYFNDSQRQATKDAGKIAGLEVLRILNEPTAAALAYGIDKADDAHTILVYDLGGGTFDVSILELGDGVFEVKSTNGNTRLGGDDFDQRLVDYIAEEFKKESGVDLRADKMTLQRVKDAAETAKIELSSATQTQVYIPFVTATSSVNLSITRAKFNELTKDLVQATIEPMKKALSDADLNLSQIDKVILVGGSTRIPAVVEAVKNFTGKEPSKGVNPDEVVGLGAAIQAGVLTGDVKDIVLLDVTPLSLGIETLGGIADVIIPRNTTIPTRTTKTYSTAQDNQPGVEIVVVQGERKMAMDNKVLGRFQLTGIMPARRGVPQIEITFDIDANGIVKVSAIDKHTNKEANITITASTNLSNDEIDKAVKEAEKFAEEDKKRQEEIEIKNNAEAAVYQTENSMNELGDKLSSEDRATLTEKLDALKAVKDGSDLEAMKKAQEDLMNAFYSISQKAYAATEGAAPSEGPAQNNGASEEDNVVDANFVEEDK